ncbi:hypothetical protein [Actinomadura montaniterrae]|uniref:Uncharacterized protein n=1 Tax=Actinomadura montaniterrae TaxID=1803903 RepID=A0A6L3VSP4_9ACTN|nr:hypothetical protein [Actinomadura montaniterrae]KAB2377452.1 hypothetical protein F9B16_24120 [Actinomadura montaniterrae]
MDDRTSRQRHLVRLLAGFFGFALTATLSVVPNAAAVEIVRVGTAAAASGAGSRGLASSPARERRSAPAWPRFSAADVHLWKRLGFVSPERHGDHSVLPSAAPDLALQRVRAAAARSRTVVPASVHIGTAPVRGPPTCTGS